MHERFTVGEKELQVPDLRRIDGEIVNLGYAVGIECVREAAVEQGVPTPFCMHGSTSVRCANDREQRFGPPFWTPSVFYCQQHAKEPNTLVCSSLKTQRRIADGTRFSVTITAGYSTSAIFVDTSPPPFQGAASRGHRSISLRQQDRHAAPIPAV